MKITFRWYGKQDRISLQQIKQIPVVSGVVSAIYDIKVGEVWPEEKIKDMVEMCKANGLECEVIESVPVHEDIKLGLPTAQKYIDNYKENIRRLAKYGVKCICYNFMPVFDWLRSELEHQNEDGSNSLAYNHNEVLSLNPLTSELSLPGWDSSYTKEGLKALLNQYKDINEEKLWENIKHFLEEIIPVAAQCDVYMGIHPDDPPWSIFGLPRIITNKENIERFLKLVDSKYNGITLCTGSLGVASTNDLLEIIGVCKGKIPFVHIRNIKRRNEFDFCETAHPSNCGDFDMYKILSKLISDGFDGYIRPDHGRMIWGEKGRYGYGLFDRALGACYIGGLIEAINKNGGKNE
ncbi:MAG: mannonate dehydratase [Clostridia bacterium]